MDQSKEFPGWLIWIREKGRYLFFGGGLLLTVIIVGVALHLESRLGKIEDGLQYVPPASYQVPDFEDYDAGDVAIDMLPIRQLVYVPVYSHVYYHGGSPYSLETTLSVRNTNVDQAIYLKSVKYFDTSGKLVKTHLDQTIKLTPLQTIEFLVERRDSSGGSGANFLVEWCAERQVDKPLIEAVMVGIAGTQGICFGRTGVEISGANRENAVTQ